MTRALFVLACVLVAFAAEARADEIEGEVLLILPKLKRKGPQPSSQPASSQPASTQVVYLPATLPIYTQAPPPEEVRLRDRGFHIGLKAQGFAQSGPLRGGPGGALEIGYRFPMIGRRLGLMLEPSFTGLWGSDSARASIGWWLAIPLGLTYHEPAGPGLFRISAAASLDLVSSDTTLADGPVHDQFLTVGAAAGIGYVIAAGPGGLILELRYRLLAYVVAGTQNVGHGGTFSLGYSFFL
ncbi:MAG: hypothetical protein IT381_26145 [Deltaproteobacteria bacterium]|nr:hypothetical protein [Deltaproteobacteria bacterium]